MEKHPEGQNRVADRSAQFEHQAGVDEDISSG